MSASLWQIEQSLVDLEELRATLVDEGDSEGVSAVDGQIKEWLTAEASKVTSYVGLIRSKQATVEAAKAEKARVDAILKAAEADVERLKANALAVMQRFDVKELKATPGGGLRRQGNGGLEPLDVSEWLNIPSEYRMVSMKVPIDLVTPMMTAANQVDSKKADKIEVTIKPQLIDTEAIREALNKRVLCPDCKGGDVRLDEHDTQAVDSTACPRCHGERTVPATVSGACLLPRGEHVRVI